ncbi:MAG: hypothetical protein HF978_19650 [Desulfobacteraceae bacterium]|nr:hypothetical protein [Desulfobacteraceae bacterium]MBC2757764.1 hypothetical protein [Desulfobacteraceae bacterium]MBC2763876.1 hypothetical protein [ANME-2 cluster archaeon]
MEDFSKSQEQTRPPRDATPERRDPRDIDWVKGEYYARKTDDEIPQAKTLAPEKEQIIKYVNRYYRIDTDALFVSRRGQFNEPKNVAIYLFRRLRRDRLNEIREYFRMEKYSSVSSVIERMKARMKTDKQLKNRVEKISGQIIKSHGQTPSLIRNDCLRQVI